MKNSEKKRVKYLHTSPTKTISRSAKKSRPKSTSTVQTEASGQRRGRRDSDSDADDTRTHTRQTTSEFIDFGGTDIYNDSGWDTDLDIDDHEAFDASGRAIYVECCKQNGVIPASYFLRHMGDVNLEMKHHGLGPQGIKPLTVALVSNTHVLSLNLTDNWLGFAGGNHVCEMMKENCYITDLDVSDNRLAASFAEKFTDVLIHNSTLTHITLAGNEFDDVAAVHLADSILGTTRIEYLNLSRNKFGEAAGLVLGPAISENSSIKTLDLSWNSLRRKGAIAIAKGIGSNVLIRKVNLSWNGFGNDGSKALGEALKVNSVLEELDITNNRITTEGAVLIGKGLIVNDALKVLKVGKNPMQSAGCYAICVALSKNTNALTRELDFSDIMVNKDMLECFEKLKENLPELKMRHGGDGVPKKPKARVHPMVKLRNYIEKHNLRLVDFFNKFDKDNSMSVTREEFAQGIEAFCKETGIKLTDDEITFLLDELDKDGDGEINYSELVMGHQDFTEKEKKMATTIMSIKAKEDKGF